MGDQHTGQWVYFLFFIAVCLVCIFIYALYSGISNEGSAARFFAFLIQYHQQSNGDVEHRAHLVGLQQL